MSRAADDVVAERRRQIEEEGWTAEHDDRHVDGSLATAAACYALHGQRQQRMEVRGESCDVSGGRGDCPVWGTKGHIVPTLWPASWSAVWWNPKSRRRDLVRAAALLIAEIERLDRVAKHGRG